jgi:hypothetical protein
MRELAYEHLNALRNSLPPGQNAFAAGDFNTTSREDGQKGMLERLVRPFWAIAHEQCDGCKGSYYYGRDDTWSFLDMILFAPGGDSDSAWQIVNGSVMLANRTPAQVTEAGTPARYLSDERRGVSDHWPLIVTLEPCP